MKVILLIAASVVKEIFRKKDVYVFFFLLLILLFFLIQATFFGISEIYRFAKEISLGMVFLFSLLITVPFSAKLMIEEIREKTIYPLLAKPVTRFQVIIGKFIGSVLTIATSFSLFYFMFLVFNISKKDPANFLLYFQTYLLGLLMLVLLNALVLFLSINFTFSATVTLAYTVYFLISWFGASLRRTAYNSGLICRLIYYLLPHFEFFDIRHRLIHLWPPLSAEIMVSIILYAIVYILGLIFFANISFRKKWL